MKWKDEYPVKKEEEDHAEPNSVYDVSFSSTGKYVLCGAGSRVILYVAKSGNIIKTMKAHKDTVYSVSFSYSEKYLASGAKDNMVIVWSSVGKGILKYSHECSIQRVRFSPVNNTLISAGSKELCICRPEEKQVERVKIVSRVRSLEWTADGSMYSFYFFKAYF